MAGDGTKASVQDSHFCLATDFEQKLADSIITNHLGAAQKMFAHCINTRALQTSVNQQARDQEVGRDLRRESRDGLGGSRPGASPSLADTEQPQGDDDGRKGGGMAGVIAMWQAHSCRQEIDSVKAQVKQKLKKANFAHPEYADKLDGVPNTTIKVSDR